VKHGVCKLCLLDKALCESHLIPGSLYDHVRTETASPIRVADGIIMPTDRQIKTRLLCKECEDILSKGGETWVCPKLAWTDRSFPLFDLLWAAGGFDAEDGGQGLFHAGQNPEIDIEKIAHFALGIFWRASVDSWKRDKTKPMITLGPEQEEIRLWLRGEGEFPKDVTLNLAISRPERVFLTMHQPVQVITPTPWRTYNCHLLGVFFSMKTGDISQEHRELCFYHVPPHLVLLSDDNANIWHQKLGKQSGDARKTKAYLAALTKHSLKRKS
jgi:hypothetical protein